MPNPYSGSKITNCNSPAIGADKDTFTGVFDAAMEAIDLHDHTVGKGNQIPTNGIVDAAITNPKMAADSVQTLQIKDANVTNSKMAADSVQTLQIKDQNVTTPKVADAAITLPKLAAVNRVRSASSGAFNTGSGVFTDVTNLVATLTPTGSDVKIEILPSPGGLVGGVTNEISCDVGALQILRETMVGGVAGSPLVIAWFPVMSSSSSFPRIYYPTYVCAEDIAPAAAGTIYRYKVQVKTSGAAFNMFNLYLKVSEVK